MAPLTCLILLANASSLLRLHAARTAQPPVLDGRLDDTAWQAAEPFDALTQKFPAEGSLPTEHTRVRVLYDDEALYVGFDCEQIRAPATTRLTRRDRWPESDYVIFDVDTRRDGKSAFHFQVNSAGTLIDALHFNDADFSFDWDENWEAQTAPTERGWSAEFRIPLRILRFTSAPIQEWGFHVERGIHALQETDESPLISRAAGGQVSNYGRLDNLLNLAPSSPFEARPFVLGRLRNRDATDDTVGTGTDTAWSIGLDLKWHLTQGLTLDATFNPDFAQVEADQVVLNLTNFETFYPEKRPFFLEGTETFSTPMQLLYTRRVGSAPALPALRDAAPYGERLVDAPEPSTIYGATKLVGRVGERTTLGLLSAVTGRNDVPVLTADGTRVNRAVAPLSVYNVVRLKRDIGEKTSAGLIFLATDRVEPAGAYPLGSGSAMQPQLCPGGETTSAGSRCFHDAYVGGADARWRSPSGNYQILGQAIASVIEGGPPRLQLDGTTIASGDVSPGGTIGFIKDGGPHYVGEVSYDVWGRKLDYNDLGYMQRQNLHHIYMGLEYRNLDPWWKTLETHTRLEIFQRWNMDGLPLGARGALVYTSWKLSNFWNIFVAPEYYMDSFDDREVGNGTALERADRGGFQLRIDTDPRRRLSGNLFNETVFLARGFSSSTTATLTFRLHSRLDLDLAPTGLFTYGEPRYVSTTDATGELLFGRLDAKSFGTTLRATYTFTPRLSLQSYAQLFLASKHYSDFLSFMAPPGGPRPAIQLGQLRPATAPTDNPDRLDNALNINVVLRWEYHLGSTLYAVYTRAQIPSATLPMGQNAGLDLASLGRAPAANVFVLKLSYWWG